MRYAHCQCKMQGLSSLHFNTLREWRRSSLRISTIKTKGVIRFKERSQKYPPALFLNILRALVILIKNVMGIFEALLIAIFHYIFEHIIHIHKGVRWVVLHIHSLWYMFHAHSTVIVDDFGTNNFNQNNKRT